MKEAITFEDVLIEPRFSTVESRKDVDLSVKALGFNLKLPLISANMDSVTGSRMAKEMSDSGAVGCLHRFWSIEDNCKAFIESHGASGFPMVSVGLGKHELERAEALYKSGAECIVIDIAHAASVGMIKQLKALRELLGTNISIVVGNFATYDSFKDFSEYAGAIFDGVKVGIGPSSVCSTRGMTAIGYPQLSAIMEISSLVKYSGITVIADGGMSKPGDVCKALGAGAHLIMSGTLFSGCEECPGEVFYHCRGKMYEKDLLPVDIEYHQWSEIRKKEYIDNIPRYKGYRGSASKESYEVQGKTASHRAPEGESILVPYKGPVKQVLQGIEGGLRSSFSYTNSRDMEEFHRNVRFVRVSNNTVVENSIRGSK